MKKAILFFAFIASISSFTQAQQSGISGKVTDQTGAVIPQATVTATPTGGKPVSATTDGEGNFNLSTLPPGTYNVTAQAKGFSPKTQEGVVITEGKKSALSFELTVRAEEQKLEVQGENQTQLDVSSESNAGALILKGKDLDALSDDPDELQSELQALAGPAAGPNGGQIYIDGFTGGQLPPKSSIREIRINQNPFSAQYDKLGYGRIEIFTKPGSDKYHGQFFFDDSNSVLNSRNPYVFTPKPSYNTDIFDGNFGGPINKKASFFLDASRRNIDEFAAIHATDPDLGPGTLTESIPNPRTRTNFNPRFDFQLTPNNTLTVRYQLTHDTDRNSGLNQFSLPSQAYNENETEHTVQISDTQILSPTVVNETRFQFQREISHQLPLSNATAVQVQGAFTAGGSAQGEVRNSENNYEFQNYTSISHHSHLIKFGARVRGLTINNYATPNFNGTAIFSPVLSNGSFIDALTVYQNFEQFGCSQSGSTSCPSQLTISGFNPNINLNLVDAGLYAEDEWRVRPNLSLTYGLRFETQNNIHDHADFAPRLGIAWGIGSNGKSAPKTVLRAGFGMFYDRFGYNLLENVVRLSGAPGSQQSITVQNPASFPANQQLTFAQVQNTPGATSSPTTYRMSADLRAPYTIQSAASVERQLTKTATLSVTYLNSIGNHQFFINNVNAPFVEGGLPPDATAGNVYQYTSEGVYRQNQLIANMRVSIGRKVSLFGFYTLSYANSNVAAGGGGGGFFASGMMSAASFLSHQYDPIADYGRAAFDVRHRAFIGGSIEAPYKFRLSPFIIINSGQPYNITTGQDNNGDSIFNDRPYLASGAAVSCTAASAFSVTPNSGGQVPVNLCTGPGNATLNLRLSRTFGFGPESKGAGGGDGGGPRMGGPRGGGPGGGLGPRGLSGGGGNPFGFGGSTNRRYNLTFSISARNLLNSANPGLPVGNLSSPFFGQSISIAGGPFSSASANRRVDLQVMFSF